jgi:flagellar hook-associated protein 2
MATDSLGNSAPVVSVGSNGSGAVGGSVINVSSLVSQLVAASRAPQEAIISSQTQAVTTQISALGSLKGALSAFQSALGTLDSPGAFDVQTASSSDESVFTATTSPGAAAGDYNISVSQLAQAQQLVSTAFAAGASAALGSGTLSISLGGNSFSVTIGSSADSLSDIAAAINSAAGNPGVAATVLTGTDGAHLVLSSTETGAANTIQVSESDSGNALAAVTYGSGNATHYAQNVAPQDASFSIAGIAYTSPSNSVSTALSGVTLNLVGTTAANQSATLSVASDTSTIESNIQAFVDAYNTLHKAIAPLGSFDATSGTAGPMLGDPLLSGVQNQIKHALYTVVNTGSATYNTLASVGITTNSDGTLSVNGGTLASALAAAPAAVSQLFSGSSGVASTLNTQLTAALGANGAFASRSTTLAKQENTLTQRENDLNDQMDALTTSLTQQFSTLNTLLSSLQTTSAYLTQAFATLPQPPGQQKN